MGIRCVRILRTIGYFCLLFSDEDDWKCGMRVLNWWGGERTHIIWINVLYNKRLDSYV